MVLWKLQKQDSNSDDKKNHTPATGDTDNNKPTGSNGNDTKTTPTTDTKAANKAETTKKKSPKTADDNRMLVWFILFAVGGTAAGVTVYGHKRRTARKARQLSEAAHTLKRETLS